MEYEKPTTATSFQKKPSSSKHPYDGVFLSSVSGAKVGPRKSEYEEIFRVSGSSSIPVLDFDQGKSTRFDARVDYSKIFGRFGDSDDFASPFEDLAAPPVKTRSPAEAGTKGVRTGHSSVSEKKQVPLPKETYESFDGVKQFNVSYNRTTNPGSKSVENGMAHVARLDAVDGYSRLIDKTAPSPMNEGGKPVRSVLNDAHVNVGTVGEPLRVPKLPRRAVSGPQPRVAANDAFPSHAEPRKRYARNRSISDDVSSDAFEIGLGMYSSGMSLSPLSATPEAASHSRSSIEPTSSKVGTSRSNMFKRAAGGRSPPSLDEDVDGNSIAAASAAAVRKAIEEAQAKIKFAKELMERKKEGRLNLARFNFDNGLKAEKRDVKNAEKSYSSRENNGLDLNGKEVVMKDSGHLDNGLKMKKNDANVEKATSSSEKEGLEMNGKDDGHLNLAKYKSDSGLKAEGRNAKSLEESNSSRENGGREMVGKEDISKQSIARLSTLDEANASQLTPNLQPEPELSRAPDIGGKPQEMGSSFTQVDHNAEVNHDGETRRQISEAAVANKLVAGALETEQADVAKKVTPSADVNELVQNVTTEKMQMECTKNVEVIEDDAKMGKVDNKLDPIQGLFAWIFSPNSITFTHEVEYEKEHILEASAASKHGEAIQISNVMHEREQLESNLKGFAEQDKRENPENQGQNHDMQEMREIIDRGEIADHEVWECNQGEMETRAAQVLVMEDNQDTHGEIHEHNGQEKGDKCEMEVDCEVNQEEGPVVKELEKEKSDAYQEADTEMNLDGSCEEEVEMGHNDVQGQEESDCRHSEVSKIEEYELLEVVDKSERIADGDRQKDTPEWSTVETARIMPENCLMNENEKATEAVQSTLRDQGSNFVVADVLCNQEHNENLSVADKGHERGETFEGVKVSAEIITSNQNDGTTGLTSDTHTNEESGKDSKAVDVASCADEEGILEATCPAQGLPRLDGFNNETADRSESPGIKNAGYAEETDINSEQKQTNLNCDERSIGLTRGPHAFEESGKEYKAVEDASNVDEEEILEAEHKAVGDASNVDEEGILEVARSPQGFPTMGGFDDETTCRIDTSGIKKNEECVDESNLNSEQKQNGDNFPRSPEDSDQEKHVEEVIWESEENDGDADGSELNCHSEESENIFMAGNTMESERLHEPELMDSKRLHEPELKEAVDSKTHDMAKQVEEVAFPLDEDMDADKSEISPVHGEEDNSSESSLEERWMNVEEHVAVHEHSFSERNWDTTEMSEEEKSCHSTGREEENHHEVEDRETGCQMQTEVENPSHLEGEEAKEREMHVEAGQQPCSTEENGKTTRKFQEKEICRNARKDEENHHTIDEREASSQVEIDVETRHHVKKEEAKEREMDKEREKRAVERAIREARERAFAEARERAARAAVERAAADVRQKVTVEGSKRLEKAPAEANAKPAANKAAMEAKLKSERAAVERATAEARERALEKALAEKAASKATNQAGKIAAEKFSSASTDGAKKSSNNAPIDHQQKGPDASNSSRHSSSSNHGGHWNKAELERQQKTAERAAKALAEKNMRDLLAQKEQAERNRLAETLDADVKRWSGGKERNLRALLSTLQYILGPDSGWQPIPLTDLISTAAVKKAYRKATLFVHPDKLQQRGASIQQKYVCEKVFDLLKDAWNKFNAEEK